ncbi:MAG: hypothetical protein ABL957_14700 [Parvularculaceae bacterium]
MIAQAMTLVFLPLSAVLNTGSYGGDDGIVTQGYYGEFELGFERQDFVFYKNRERYWIAGTKSSLEKIVKALPKSRGRLHGFGLICGVISEEGQFGHFGLYERTVTIYEIKRISTTTFKFEGGDGQDCSL